MSDALERLKRRNRPKVKPRNTQVEQQDVDIQTSRHIDVKTQEEDAQKVESPHGEDIQTSRHTSAETQIETDLSDLDKVKTSQPTDIHVSRHIDLQMSASTASLGSSEDVEELEVKRSTFRLEAGLIGRLHRLCQDNGISREVMIESMFEYMEQDPEALNQVVGVAKSKNVYRQQIANRKRAKAMIEKFG